MYKYDFLQEITMQNANNFIERIDANKEKIDELAINIGSYGGDVAAGIILYHYLKSLPFNVTTHNIGETSSSAILFYLGGSKRSCAPTCKFLIHPITYTLNGLFNYYDLKQKIEIIKCDIKNYAEIVNKETNHLNNIYNINKYLKYDTLVLDKNLAYKCGISNVE